MKTIVEEKPISFKELEQKIFSYVCELGREITTAMLEAYDKELAEGRDKKNYRDKGIRTTTIKTVYGEVSSDCQVIPGKFIRKQDSTGTPFLKPVLCKDIQTPFRKNCIAVHPVLRIPDMNLHI